MKCGLSICSPWWNGDAKSSCSRYLRTTFGARLQSNLAVGDRGTLRHMTKRWGIAVGVVSVMIATAGCSGSTASKGVVSTTTPPEATSAPPPATDGTDATTPPSDSTPATDASVAPPVRLGGTLTVGLDAEPSTLDPAANSLSLANGSVYAAVYEGLFVGTPGKPAEPLLAESLVESEDRLSWTLTLRSGITFQDGTPLNAEAVKFNLERQKASPFNGPGLLPLVAIEVVDELTATLVLSEPWTALPSVLAGVNGQMASPTAAADPAAFARAPVGTGPYKFVEWVPTDKVVLAKYDGYWGEPAPLDELVFKFISVEAARVAAFEGGEIDAYTTITEATAEQAEADGAQVIAPPPTGYGFSYINLTKAPLNDVRVRRAMQLASDREAIAEAYQGQGYADASFSPLFTNSPYWVPPADPPTFDPEAAKALIADYGQPVKFTFKLLLGSQEIEDGVRASIEYWNDAGMDVDLEIIPDLGTYINDVLTGNYDVLGFLGTSSGDPDTVFYNLLHTGGASNYGKYSNPEMDAALEQGRRSNDEAERKAAYATVQEIFREDLPISISSHGRIFIVTSDAVASVEPAYFFPSSTIRRAG
jgi:peptide/nickel transport system substrate-binding protein